MANPRESMVWISACTAFALAAFAANSVLCRLALGDQAIDGASFTTIRLVSGAAMLTGVELASRGHLRIAAAPDWLSAAALFVYAAAFSFAYLSLAAGTGALILFGAVQLTMLLAALASGERPRPAEWIGLTSALGGLIYLTSPGFGAPPLAGSVLMAAAGVAWGCYSLRGRGASDPLGTTAGNFVGSVPLAATASLLAVSQVHVTTTGVVLAVLSGAFTSGVGYVAWYAALGGLTSTRAATLQLSVPVLAAGGGVLFLGEAVSFRLVLAAILVLGGIALTVSGRPSGGAPRMS